MDQLIYFVEQDGAGFLTPEAITASGLSHAAAGMSVQQLGIGNGPSGKAGILLRFFEPTGKGTKPEFDPPNQDWYLGGKFWVGKQKDALIRPGDLARKRFIRGEEVELADGNQWTVPIARALVSGQTLPQSLVLGRDMQTWELETLPEFLEICADAEKVFNAFQAASVDGDSFIIKFDLQESLWICVRALSVNYRVSAVEVGMLRLLTTENRWFILEALIDYAAVKRYAAMEREAAAKKKDDAVPGEPSMSSGEAAA